MSMFLKHWSRKWADNVIVAGDVLLGGQNAESFSRGEWAKAVALVSQEPVLFAGVHTSGFLFLLC